MLIALASFCRETLQVERALLRTLVERATERAFHPSYHLTPTGGAGNKASFATETSITLLSLDRVAHASGFNDKHRMGKMPMPRGTGVPPVRIGFTT